MSCWIFAAYGLAALFFIFLLQAALPVRSRFAWMAESDSDMKLAPFPGTKASAKDALEPSSEEIELYFKHKRCHNLDHARQLGTKLGESILSLCSGFGGIFLTDKELFHARMLYLFVTEDCVRRFVPAPDFVQADPLPDQRHHLGAAPALLQQPCPVPGLHRLQDVFGGGAGFPFGAEGQPDRLLLGTDGRRQGKRRALPDRQAAVPVDEGAL